MGPTPGARWAEPPDNHSPKKAPHAVATQGGEEVTRRRSHPVMSKTNKKPTGNGAPLDKLAQPVRNPGAGGAIDTLRRRARAKWYSYGTLVRLANLDAPTLYPDVPTREALTKHYWRCTHCSELLHREGKAYRTDKYCNGRVCNACGRIRTGKLWNAWHKMVGELQGVQFTTLTRTNVSAYELRDTFRSMAREWSLLIRNLRHHKGIDVNGIRRVECTVSDRLGNFHPHLHILHDGGPEVGEAIIQEWMRRHPGTTDRKAQHTREADADAYAETFKYAAKQWEVKKGKDGSRIRVDITSLDVIVQALWGLRTFQSFGRIRKAMNDAEEQEDAMTLDEPGVIVEDAELSNKGKAHYSRCIWDGTDWIDQSDNTPVSNFKPPPKNIIRYTMSSQPRDGCGGQKKEIDASIDLQHCMKWMEKEDADIQAMPRLRYWMPPDPERWKPMDDAPPF